MRVEYFLFRLFSFDIGKANPEIETPIYHTDPVKVIESQKGPRFIKTHLRWPYLPKEIQDGTKKPKVIIIP